MLGGTPQARRAGNPCHGWGSSKFGEGEFVNERNQRENLEYRIIGRIINIVVFGFIFLGVMVWVLAFLKVI